MLKIPQQNVLVWTKAFNAYTVSLHTNKCIGLVIQAYENSDIGDAIIYVNTAVIMHKKNLVDPSVIGIGITRKGTCLRTQWQSGDRGVGRLVEYSEHVDSLHVHIIGTSTLYKDPQQLHKSESSRTMQFLWRQCTEHASTLCKPSINQERLQTVKPCRQNRTVCQWIFLCTHTSLCEMRIVCLSTAVFAFLEQSASQYSWLS